MDIWNRSQPIVMPIGANLELWLHRNGLLSLGPAARRRLTVAQSLDEALDAAIANLSFQNGMYSKDYSRHCTSANFVAHDLELRQARENIENEIAVLWLCSNSNHIVRLHTVYQAHPTVRPALTMTRVAGASLKEVLRRRPVTPEKDVKMCIRDILRALHELHRLGIAHLDLKPQKVLLVGGRFGEGVKLCGFRLARMMGGDVRTRRNLIIDTDYKAPELIRVDAVSLATDIWSVGVMAYVMLMGRLPFFSPNYPLALVNILQHHITSPMAFADSLRGRMSPEAVDFIDRCTIVQNQSDRLTVEQCLAHPWLAPDTPDPLWMLRTLADVCANVGTSTASGQPSSHQQQQRRPVAEGDLRSATTGRRARVRASGRTRSNRRHRHVGGGGRPTASTTEPRAPLPDASTELPPP